MPLIGQLDSPPCGLSTSIRLSQDYLCGDDSIMKEGLSGQSFLRLKSDTPSATLLLWSK